VRVVGRSTFGPHAAGAEGGTLLAYEIGADGFLRHMVRALVGTLVEVGRGTRTPESVRALLAGGGRSEAGPTAPAHGLFLVGVDY
jgi:tRNA pseudouridine38-40 synthase